MWIVAVFCCIVVAVVIVDVALVRAFRLAGKGKAPQRARDLARAVALGLVLGVSQAIQGMGLWLIAICPAAAVAGALAWIGVWSLIRRVRSAEGQ
jgi:hypothetical protein